MKRVLLFVAVMAVILGVLWLLGNAPSAFVLEEECKRFQKERRERDGALTVRIAKLEEEALMGKPPVESLIGLKRERDGIDRATRRTSMRGWDVILIPAGAARPDPGDFLIHGRIDVSSRADPARLRGEMEVWIQPSGGLAKLVFWLGLSP